MTHTARHRMMASAVAGLLATSLGATATATAAPRGQVVRPCTISTLPYPADTYRAEANAIDSTGRFTAGAALRVSDSGNQNLLLVWDRGILTTIESPLVDDAVDVNAHGVVVGDGSPESYAQPWRYRDGHVEQLPVLSTSGTYVTAINDSGDIVGYAWDDATGQNVPLRWPAAQPGTVEVLSAPSGATAKGITNDGTIVGTAGSFGDWSGWVRRPNGRIDALTTPGARTTLIAAAQGPFALGQVALADGTTLKLRWDLRDGSYTMLDQRLEWLEDVNAQGVVAGGSRVVREGTSRVLPGGGAQVPIGARAISDTGTIVGFRNAERVTPVRWNGC
ncbi:hypothetical protein V6V47_24330 [Micromonospora sp. CPCC 205539]|uniref:hypothetical protein n=1 Tax=Micromonospora sp. CPCC 205539 TaxID=3122408 RepID=UPI002FF25CED